MGNPKTEAPVPISDLAPDELRQAINDACWLGIVGRGGGLGVVALTMPVWPERVCRASRIFYVCEVVESYPAAQGLIGGDGYTSICAIAQDDTLLRRLADLFEKPLAAYADYTAMMPYLAKRISPVYFPTRNEKLLDRILQGEVVANRRYRSIIERCEQFCAG